jgi:CheY-like chemotaxis protein/N-acetylglutamate synthase-like GNAT family acetyltransferase
MDGSSNQRTETSASLNGAGRARFDCLWISQLGDRVVGAVGLIHIRRRAVQLTKFRIDPDWQHTSIPRNLVRRVHDYCRDHGRLKLVVETGAAPGWFHVLIQQSGFHLARQPALAGKAVMEFRLDAHRKSRGVQRRQPCLARLVETATTTCPSSATQRPLRVLLADDHPLQLHGLAELLRTQPELDVIGEAQDGLEAVEMALRAQPDVVLMDVNMPRMNGIEATHRITSELPGVRVIGLSINDGDSTVRAMLRAGAATYLRKGGPTEAVVAAVLSRT